jgi:hypothetical protein
MTELFKTEPESEVNYEEEFWRVRTSRVAKRERGARIYHKCDFWAEDKQWYIVSHEYECPWCHRKIPDNVKAIRSIMEMR